MNLVVGQTLAGHYQIINSLGEGGFGQTYLAYDNYLPGNPLCVVKQLKPQSTDPSTLQTARRLLDTEAKVLYQLGNHDRIPRLFAYFEENQEFYLVQEFIAGHDLSQELSPSNSNLAKQGWDDDKVVSLLQDILEILEFVHQQNVIHRDVNPRNLIRRDQDGKLVLIDFGAVKQISTNLVNSQLATRYSISIGTPGYMPSEQANGNPRLSSDIYAVGMIGIQVLTGLIPNQLPEDPDTGEILWRDRIQVEMHKSLLLDVLDNMVRYDFRQRYRSASEALQAIKDLSSGRAKLVSTTSATITLPAAKLQHSINKPKKSGSVWWKVLISTGLIGAAIASFYISNAINSNNAKELYKQGKIFYDLNRYEEALDAYKKATQIRPDYPEAWGGEGNTLLDLKRYKEALNSYDRAIQTGHNYVEGWVGRGYVLNNLERYQEAIDSFDKAIKIQPNSAEAWNGRGEAMLNLQRYEQAIAAYDKAVQFKSDYYQAWYNRGWALYNLKRYQDAIASFEQAIEYKSDSYQAWYNRGNAFINLQRYKEAVESYDKTVQYKPEYYQAWYSRGNALINLQQYKEAVRSFDSVVRYQPDFYEAWYNRGWAFHQLQRYEEALGSYDKALQYKRKDEQVWYNRGNALYNLKRYQEAIASYDRAVRIKPEHYEAWYSRGNALDSLKRYKEAIVSYDKAIKYKPDFQQAIDARKRWQETLLKPQPLNITPPASPAIGK